MACKPCAERRVKMVAAFRRVIRKPAPQKPGKAQKAIL